MGLFDLWPKRSKKERMRERIAENRMKGKAAEEQFRIRSFLEGKEVERTGRGHDFRVRERDLWTGRVKRSYVVEVKSGKSRLSRLQKKARKRKSNYKVAREDPWFY